MTLKFLIVTANSNETNAILEDKDFFKYETARSSDPHDVLFYNVGNYGAYECIHFELPDQGSVKTDASILSIHRAITIYNPDAIILAGISFGKDDEDKDEPRQHIGDVLVSTSIGDYESGKIEEGAFKSDGSIPDAGRGLLAAFRHYSKSWEYNIDSRVAKCEFGLVLSGDKVCDDEDFKKKLFDAYPRAIGGEMEARGAYAACRSNGVSEWIVIKAICDWGVKKRTHDKEAKQIIAARSTASLLRHVFSKPEAFAKIMSQMKVKNGSVSSKTIKEVNEIVFERQSADFLNSSAMPWLPTKSISRDHVITNLLVSSKIKLSKHSQNSNFVELLDEYEWKQNTLIYGAPGAGKSTLLYCIYKKILECYANDFIVVFLNARKFPIDNEYTDIESAIVEYLNTRHQIKYSTLNNEPTRYMILVDGLDEVNATISDMILTILNKNSSLNHVLIATCREYTYNERSFNNSLYETSFNESIYIEPWNLSSLSEFARKYLKSIGEDNKLNNFKRVISNDHLRSLCSNPFLLTIIIYLFLDNPDLSFKPNSLNMFALYKKFISTLWKSEKRRHPGNCEFDAFELKCKKVARTIYNDSQMTSISKPAKITNYSNDSAIFCIFFHDDIEGLNRFRHESLFDYFIADNFIDTLRYEDISKLIEEFQYFYNYYINQFIRDAIEYFNEEKVIYYEKFSDIYNRYLDKQWEVENVSCDSNTINTLMAREAVLQHQSKIIKRELSVYYIGRLKLDDFPAMLRDSYYNDTSPIIKRTAAIGAMLYNEETIEFDYIDSLAPGSMIDLTHRSLTLLYFKDAYGSIFSYKDDSNISWDKSKTAIINRLKVDSPRNFSFRLWDIKTLYLFCLSRKSCNHINDNDIKVIVATSTTNMLLSSEKSSRITKEKKKLLLYIKSNRNS